jgi:sugar phosphate isomerase/epimerase
MKCLERIKELGFDGVEVCLEHPDLLPEKLSSTLAQQVAAKIRELGLTPHSVSYHVDYVYNTQMFDDTCKAIGLTQEFGTDIFVFGCATKRTGDAEEWQRKVERTRALVRIAEQHGVILADEFEPGFILGSTADLHRLFQAIPSPNLMANLDVGHVFLCDPDPMEAIASLKGKIAHVHIENMEAGVHRHLVPQEGDMDMTAYLKALRDTGFDGALALDLYEQDYEAVAPESLTYLRRCLSSCDQIV